MSKKNYLTEDEANAETERLANEYFDIVLKRTVVLSENDKKIILDGFKHGYKEALYRHDIIQV